MPDISMCSGDGCPIKEKCYRFTAKPDEYLQSYIQPPYKDGKCEMFWPINTERLDKLAEFMRDK